jgi:hypothetical protein
MRVWQLEHTVPTVWRILIKWLRVLQIPLTSCRIWRNLILPGAAISFT